MNQGLLPIKTIAAQVLLALALGLTPGNLIPIAWAQPPKAKLRAEWEKTVEAAKKEGQVNVYVTLGPHEVIPAFQKAYPAIRPVIVAGRSAQIAQRIAAERRAGKYLADVEIGGGAVNLAEFYSAGFLDPIRPLLALPEVVDESKWWQAKHRYLDPEDKYILVFIGVPQNGSIYYNTNAIHPKDFKSLWDFLHPKWKGKLLARDPRDPGPGGGAMRFYYHSPAVGPQFIKRLFGEMEIVVSRDERQATDWLAIGKFPLCFFCRDVQKAKRQGVPVDEFGLFKEGAGLTSQGGTITFIRNAPHPNATKVFVNWLLSREGQIAYQTIIAKIEGSHRDSLRIDIPKDEIPPLERRLDGVSYVDVDTPERRDMRPIFKLLEEALAESRKK
jgi:iron(III) transport system substrate-binding protein